MGILDPRFTGLWNVVLLNGMIALGELVCETVDDHNEKIQRVILKRY